MLFFFELFLFALVMVTLALGEFVSRWLALIVWCSATGLVLLGYLLARRALRDVLQGDGAHVQPGSGRDETVAPHDPVAADEASAAPPDAPPAESPSPAVSALDERWARTLLYNWRRSNVLLILGAGVVAAWYWLAG